MKKAAGFYADSLEMLLDTMCNLLGAIVFIALLVALLAQDAPQVFHQEQAVQLSNELASITVSNSMVESELQQTLLRLQNPRTRAATNLMRLPVTSQTGKKPWTVIVRSGKLYPADFLSRDARGKTTIARNFRTLQWDTQKRPAPKAGFPGDEPDQGVLEMAGSFGSGGPANYYFIFCVYEDSFEAFMRAREAAARLGYQYGWKPLANTDPLILESHGESVLPQN